jgi:hypothetical protein
MSVLDAPTADVAGYAADVRRALSGLTPEQVDDLTDDLEQTLADALADDHRSGAGVGLVGMFGPATAYADELRSAAGLDAGSPPRRALGERASHVRRTAVELLAPMRAQPWSPGLASAVAPVWWVLRGWVVYMVLQVGMTNSGPAAPLPDDFAEVLLLLALVLVSVRWGQGAWRRGRLLTAIFWIVSVGAAILVVPLLADAQQQARDGAQEYDVPIMQPADGVYVGGAPVANLFVYDADGNPVSGAQVFDDQGRPVTTASDPTGYWNNEVDGSTVQLVPAAAADGSQRWNAYPLRTQEFNYDDPDAPGAVVDPLWPFAQAGAILLPPPGPAAPDDATTPGATPSGAAPSAPAPSGAAPSGAAPSGAAPSGDPSGDTKAPKG